MKLEDCTKDELIYIIKNRCYYQSENIEFDVLMYRSNKTIAAEKKYMQMASESLDKYIKLMKPYDGKPFANIPGSVITKASAAMNEHHEFSAAAERENKKTTG